MTTKAQEVEDAAAKSKERAHMIAMLSKVRSTRAGRQGEGPRGTARRTLWSGVYALPTS